jgi:hypothetical protein
MELPEVSKVERLSLRPGDRLVLTVDRLVDDREFDVLRERVGEWAQGLGLPENGVVILEAGLSLQVLEAADA